MHLHRSQQPLLPPATQACSLIHSVVKRCMKEMFWTNSRPTTLSTAPPINRTLNSTVAFAFQLAAVGRWRQRGRTGSGPRRSMRHDADLPEQPAIADRTPPFARHDPPLAGKNLVTGSRSPSERAPP